MVLSLMPQCSNVQHMFNSRQIKGLSFSQMNVSLKSNRLGGWTLSGKSQWTVVSRMQQATSFTPALPVAGEFNNIQIQTLRQWLHGEGVRLFCKENARVVGDGERLIGRSVQIQWIKKCGREEGSNRMLNIMGQWRQDVFANKTLFTGNLC